MNKQRQAYRGLNQHRRITWNDPYNRTCIALARAGFSIETIARETGLTKGQVIYRCGKKNLHVSDYRNGIGAKALAVLNSFALTRKTGS